MKILIDIDHPSTVHLFKHFIWEMQKKGNTVLITAMEKELVFDLLKEYQFDYVNLGDVGASKRQKILKLPNITQKLYQIAKEEKPDLIMGAATIPGAWVAKILGIPCINFEDTDIATLAHTLYMPFARYAISPEQYTKDFGSKHIRYAGFKELAYTHPNHFKADPYVLDELGFTSNDLFFVVRFSAWGATHDIGKSGLSYEEKKKLITTLSQRGRVLISSEGELEPEFEVYRYKIAYNKILDVLHYAALLVTDAHTMATEAALLGTPAIRCNSIVGENDMGNFIELEEKYDLMYSYNDFNLMMAKINDLLKIQDLKSQWSVKVNKMLRDKVDLTQWILDFVEEKFSVQESVLQ